MEPFFALHADGLAISEVGAPNLNEYFHKFKKITTTKQTTPSGECVTQTTIGDQAVGSVIS